MGEVYGLVLSFSGLFQNTAEERAFVNGVEFGQLWSRMTGGQEVEIAGTFHAANRVVIERACAGQGWSIEIAATGDDFHEWVDVKMAKTKSATPNPHGLRAVK